MGESKRKNAAKLDGVQTSRFDREATTRPKLALHKHHWYLTGPGYGCRACGVRVIQTVQGWIREGGDGTGVCRGR